MNSTSGEKIWYDLVQKACSNYSKLTPDERIWFNIRTLIDSVDDGGLSSFYYNYGADNLEETMEDLNILGAKKVISILEKINNLFPAGNPPKNIDERNDIINSWEDGEYDELIEELDEQFYSFEEKLESKLKVVVDRVISGRV